LYCYRCYACGFYCHIFKLFFCVAFNLLSLALDAMPQCAGRILTNDVSRTDKLTMIVETLMRDGSVLMPYPFTLCLSISMHLCMHLAYFVMHYQQQLEQ